MIQLTEDAINRIQLAIGGAIRLITRVKHNEVVKVEADITGQLTKAGITAYWVGDMIRVDIKL